MKNTVTLVGFVGNTPEVRTTKSGASITTLSFATTRSFKDADGSARVVAGRMANMAKGLERDPQVESLLRNRTRELGLGKDIGRDLSRDLAASVSFERTRSIGMSL